MTTVFDTKYGFEEDHNVKQFHQSRIMFAIYNNELYIADKTSDSHATWFKKMGWITENEDSLMDIIVRGYVDQSGIYFYRGYDFISEMSDEKIFLNKLGEIKEKLNLHDSLTVFSGLIKQTSAGKFPTRKILGIIKDLI